MDERFDDFCKRCDELMAEWKNVEIVPTPTYEEEDFEAMMAEIERFKA